MKAEPESRLEKGYDVKFSIDDLAARTEPEAWDGEFTFKKPESTNADNESTGVRAYPGMSTVHTRL